MTTEEKVSVVLQALDERKAQEIRVLDVSERTQLTDRLIICSGTSNIHIRAVVDRILEMMKERGIKGIRCEGYREARWVLIDFGDVVVHVFDPEERAYYRLEEFWTRAPRPAEASLPASQAG